MPRYRAHTSPPRAMYDRLDWSTPYPALPEVDRDGPVFTGLLSARGHAIYRHPDPIGFVADDE